MKLLWFLSLQLALWGCTCYAAYEFDVPPYALRRAIQNCCNSRLLRVLKVRSAGRNRRVPGRPKNLLPLERQQLAASSDFDV